MRRSFASSILLAQWPVVFVLHVCKIMDANRLNYYCLKMSGKRKKDDSEAVGIMKFVKSAEIFLFISSLNYLWENLKQMLSLEVICVLT